MTQTMEAPPQQRDRAAGPLALARDTRTLRTMLAAVKESIAMTIPKHMTPDRLIKVALVAVSRSELLQQCTADSIMKCVMVSAQLGLDCSGVLGSAYMVPFWNKKISAREATLIPGYRGLIDLARRSGQIASIEARVVYQGEVFEYEQGLEPKLVHKPNFEKEYEDKDIRLVYAIARFKDPEELPQVEVMSKARIDAIRRRSQSADQGPWVTDYGEMARKTVVKRLSKYLPLTVEFQTAVDLDNRFEHGEGIGDIINGEMVGEGQTDLPAGPRSRAAALAQRVAPHPTAEGRVIDKGDSQLPEDSEEGAAAPIVSTEEAEAILARAPRAPDAEPAGPQQQTAAPVQTQATAPPDISDHAAWREAMVGVYAGQASEADLNAMLAKVEVNYKVKAPGNAGAKDRRTTYHAAVKGKIDWASGKVVE